MNPSNAALIITVLILIILLLILWIDTLYKAMKEYKKHIERLTSNRLRQEADQGGEESRELEESNKPVSCLECRCLIIKQESYKVLASVRYIDYLCDVKYEYHYCQKCKPNYTRIESKELNDSSLIHKYFKELEVTEEGEPIGYKKNK